MPRDHAAVSQTRPKAAHAAPDPPGGTGLPHCKGYFKKVKRQLSLIELPLPSLLNPKRYEKRQAMSRKRHGLCTTTLVTSCKFGCSCASLDFCDGFMDGLGHIVQVFGSQATHVDTPTSHQVDVFFLDHVLHLLSWGNNWTSGQSRDATAQKSPKDQSELLESFTSSRKLPALGTKVLPDASFAPSHTRAPVRSQRVSCLDCFGPVHPPAELFSRNPPFTRPLGTYGSTL